MSSAEESLNCVFCNESFTDKETLQIHFRKHGDPQFMKESPSKSKTPEHVQGPETVTEKKVELVSCDVCTEVFPTISKAITHKHKVHPDHDAKYFCCWCGKLFTLKHLYNKHLTSHETKNKGSGKVYHCDCCNVDFNVPSAMIYHNKIFHRQDSDFSSIGQSTKQKLVDQELCPLYYCAFCGEEHINKVNLHKHMTDDHSDENQSPNEVLRCPLCQAIFYHLDAYEVHLTFHSSEDVYNDNDESKSELSEFTLDSVPPVTEKVEDYEPESEVRSPGDSMDIDQLLQLASDGETKKRPKKHKKHKKSKKSAITLDEFLNMNTDVFGEGLNIQGVEEVPTRVISKQFKVKGATTGATVKKELNRLKQQGIVVRKKSNKVPVFPGVKVQLGMQNKVQKPLKIAPCALKPIPNVPNTEAQLKKLLPKSNEEVLSNLLSQSNSQIQIIKKPVLKNSEESLQSDQTNKNWNPSDTPEKIEVECDLLLRSSEPSSELDPEDRLDENKSEGIALTSVSPDPTSIKESNITNLIHENNECNNSTKICKSLEKGPDEHSTINSNDKNNLEFKTSDGVKNLNSLKALKSIQHLTIKQLKPSESNFKLDLSISKTENVEKDITDSDFEDAIPATKIVNITPTKNSGTEEKTKLSAKDSNNSTQKQPIASVTQSVTQFKPDKNEDNKILNRVNEKSNTMQEKQNFNANTGIGAGNFLKNISQQIALKPVSTNTVKSSTLVEQKQETTDKTTDTLKNLSKHITIKSVTQSPKSSNNGEDDNNSMANNNVITSPKKVIPMPQGNIKHFPQITVTSLSKKGADDYEQSDNDEDFDRFDSDLESEIKPTIVNSVSNIEHNKNRNLQQMQYSKQRVIKSDKISQNVLHNKQVTIKSSSHTFISSTNVTKSKDESEHVDRHFSDNDDDADDENIMLPSYNQSLQGKINKNLIIKPAKNNSPTNINREKSVPSPCHSPNAKKVFPANNQNQKLNDAASKRFGVLRKLNQGITIKSLPQKENAVSEEPEIFNIEDSDSDNSEMPVVPTNSQKPINTSRANLDVQKSNTKQNEQQQKKQKGPQQTKSTPADHQKWQLVKHTAQPTPKIEEGINNDYFSTDEEGQQQYSDSDDGPDICPNISKLLSNKNISLKNTKGCVPQALKKSIPNSHELIGKSIKKSQNGQSKSDLLKDFHFNESSEDDVDCSAPLRDNKIKITGNELAIKQSDEFLSDNDDENVEDTNEDETALFEDKHQDIINKLKNMNANVSIKTNNPSGQQILNQITQNLGEGALNSSSQQSKKTVTYTQSQAMKRNASESFSGNTNIRRNIPTNPGKQIKLADEEPQSEDMLNSSSNQSKMLSQLSDMNTVNQEVSTSVKTIQTKTVVQEITTTVTRTVKTVNQEVAVTSSQVAGNATVTNPPRMQKFIQGMPKNPAQVRNFNNTGTPQRFRVPTNTRNLRPTNPVRPSGNTAIRSPNNAIRVRPPVAQQVKPGPNRMPGMKKVAPAQGNQSQNQPACKPIKIAPNVLKQRQQLSKPVTEPGPFSCFKKPNESLFPSGLSGDTTSVASTSQISRSNVSSSTRTFKSDSYVTATNTKSEFHSSHQEIKKLSNLSGLKVVRSSQSTQAVNEVQKIEVSDPKRQSTLDAIQRLQRQGLLLKKPRLEEPDECEQSDSGCEDNDNHNLALEDSG